MEPFLKWSITDGQLAAGEYAVMAVGNVWRASHRRLPIADGELEACLRACSLHSIRNGRFAGARITRRQSEFLRVFAELQARDGMPPTIRELGDALGIKSPNGVNSHLRALEKRGLLQAPDGAKSRGWKLKGVVLK